MNIEVILFCISAIIVINYITLLIGQIIKNSLYLPVPILHFFKVEYGNCYVSFFGLFYQIYFWSNYFEIFN